MKIRLWPDLVTWALSASVAGDMITINGEPFDFSPLKEGQRLPGSAIDSAFFPDASFVERKAGVLHMTLIFPVQPDSPEEYRNPAEPIIIDARSGTVKFPDASPPAPEPVEPPEEVHLDEDQPESV